MTRFITVPFFTLAEVEPAGLAEIRDPLPIYFWLWIGLAIAGAFLAIGLYLWFRKPRDPKPKEAKPEIVRPAEEIALEELEALRRTKSEMAPEPFTVKITGIVRHYIEDKFNIPAPDLTTEEFLQTVDSSDAVPKKVHETMPQFLTQCDFVKFARQDLEEEAKDQLLLDAESLVKESFQKAMKAEVDTPKKVAKS